MNRKTSKIWFAAVALLALGLGTAAFGQAATGDAAVTTPVLTWRDMWRFGGPLMYVLAFLSVLAVAFITYFFIVLRKDQIAPDPQRRALIDTLRRGARDDARRVCEARPCPLSAICLVALDYLRDAPQADSALLKDIMEGEGARQADNIQGQTQYLLDVAVVAPMVGLLGTVFGMIQAFSVIALDIARAKPILLAAGVSQALITTAFGLIIGIPAMAFFAYFRRQSSKLVSHLESAATELLTTLLGNKTP
ncbi:MAG: MotA/TolQ/ExbB proton channel family protein [Lentisphaerae bacterium]|nr:MotA/TolQ/ExbB proton channel family protein [Lentisphaerota bacterium]